MDFLLPLVEQIFQLLHVVVILLVNIGLKLTDRLLANVSNYLMNLSALWLVVRKALFEKLFILV